MVAAAGGSGSRKSVNHDDAIASSQRSAASLGPSIAGPVPQLATATSGMSSMSVLSGSGSVDSFAGLGFYSEVGGDGIFL